MTSDAGFEGWTRRAALRSLLALPLGFLALPLAADEAAAPNGELPPSRAARPRRRPPTTIDDRVRLLTKALDLDPKQQAALRGVLEDQRQQVARLWDDASVPPPNRVAATQAIGDKTADRIRALLNDEQKQKYNAPRQPRDTAAGARGPSVEDWMYPAKPK